MNWKFEVVGLEKLDESIASLMRSVPEATEKGLAEIGLLIEGTARRSIQEHQSEGRQYKRGGRVFTASLPGYPPNSQHGAAGFVGTIQNEVDDADLSVTIGTNDKRGPWFEFGTQHMEPRPWLSPAIDANEEDITRILSEVVRDALG